MAKGKYRPYGTGSEAARRNRLIAIVLMLLIAGLVILIQLRKKKASASGVSEGEIPKVSLSEIAPSAPSRPEPPAVEIPSAPSSAPSSASAPSSSPAEKPQPQPEQAETGGSVGAAAVAQAASPEIQALIEKAVEARKTGKIIAARDFLNEALQKPMSEVLRDEIKRQLSLLAGRWLFSREVLEGDTLTEWYQVQPGDLLTRIANTYKVPYEILMEINGIRRAESLQAGQRIKVIRGPFHAVISRKRYTMDLFLQNQYIKTYRVGLGTPGHETPRGLWRVKPNDKMIQPPWTDPDTGRRYVATDPDYPLGSRWIGLEGLEGEAKGRTGFAIHGTKEPETIGTQSSRGCIRLHNGDVIEVYNLLFAGQSLVRVED
ncbi:MAG: L,D-transpeptidase family protein [Anaerohalosphaeraceae bacterium]